MKTADIKNEITGNEKIDNEHKCFKDQILNREACCRTGDTLTAPSMTDKVAKIVYKDSMHSLDVVTESGQTVPMKTLCKMVDAGQITIN